MEFLYFFKKKFPAFKEQTIRISNNPVKLIARRTEKESS